MRWGAWPAAAVVAWLGCKNESAPGADEADGSGDGIAVDSSGTADADADDGDDRPRLDNGPTGETGGPGDCQGGGGNGESYSLIWIANSPEGTVSKIDTVTGVELGRYYTGPNQGSDDPSRTSVNLTGDVAVTNRSGGIAKIASVVERCVDIDGDGEIQTSTGANDVLEYGTDECLLWYQPLPSDGNNTHGPRPTAWDTGNGNDPCAVNDDRVWVGWWDYEPRIGHFRRLDGATGETLDDVEVPDWNPQGDPDYGPYGGAVDGEGDFWAVGLFIGPLVRIDAETLEVSRWEVPEEAQPYGIALDAEGRPWMAGWDGEVVRFNPASEAFDVIPVPGDRRMRGLQIDREGSVWVAANDPCGAVQIDVNTLAIIRDDIELPDCSEPVGVSIDADGFVWLPDRSGNKAYRLDPSDYTTRITEGLVGPYTYSDMTGAGLGLVTNPPTG